MRRRRSGSSPNPAPLSCWRRSCPGYGAGTASRRSQLHRAVHRTAALSSSGHRPRRPGYPSPSASFALAPELRPSRDAEQSRPEHEPGPQHSPELRGARGHPAGERAPRRTSPSSRRSPRALPVRGTRARTRDPRRSVAPGRIASAELVRLRPASAPPPASLGLAPPAWLPRLDSSSVIRLACEKAPHRSSRCGAFFCCSALAQRTPHGCGVSPAEIT